MNHRPALRSIGAFAGCLVLLAGCGAGGSDSGVKTPLPREGSVRVVNALTDSGSMSSFLSSSIFAVNQYGDSTDLRQVLVGQYVMNILLTPPDDLNVPLVANEQLDLTDPDEVSFYLIGTTATPQEVRIHNQDIAYQVNLNNPAAFPPPDYQILHAAMTSVAAVGGTVDVYVTDASTDITTVAPTATLSFGEHTDLARLDPAVTYRVQVTKSPLQNVLTDVLYDSGGFTLARLQRSTFMLMDNYGSYGVALRVANINATGATSFANETLQGTMRVTNEMPDVPSIDVYLGDPEATTPPLADPVATGVAFGATTGYFDVPNGDFTVYVTAAGVRTTLAKRAVTLVGGQARGVYASGLATITTSTAAVDAFVESQRSITGQSQVRFVDAAPSAGIIDVYLLVPGQNVGDVSPIVAGGALLVSTPLALTPGSYDIAVTRTSTTVQLFGPERIVVADGGVYSAVLVEAAGGGPPLTLQFTQETIPPP